MITKYGVCYDYSDLFCLKYVRSLRDWCPYLKERHLGTKKVGNCSTHYLGIIIIIIIIIIIKSFFYQKRTNVRTLLKLYTLQDKTTLIFEFTYSGSLRVFLIIVPGMPLPLIVLAMMASGWWRGWLSTLHSSSTLWPSTMMACQLRKQRRSNFKCSPTGAFFYEWI